MIKYFKNLLTSFLIWLRQPKIGHIHIDVPVEPLNQNIKVDQGSLDVDMEEWADTFKAVFETSR